MQFVESAECNSSINSGKEDISSSETTMQPPPAANQPSSDTHQLTNDCSEAEEHNSGRSIAGQTEPYRSRTSSDEQPAIQRPNDRAELDDGDGFDGLADDLQHMLFMQPVDGGLHSTTQTIRNIAMNIPAGEESGSSLSVGKYSYAHLSSSNSSGDVSRSEPQQSSIFSSALTGSTSENVYGDHEPVFNQVHRVHFKHYTKNYLLSEQMEKKGSVPVGRHVVVKVERGEDMGVVIECMSLQQLLRQATRAAAEGDDSYGIVERGRILRVATPAETGKLTKKANDEQKVIDRCSDLAARMGLPIVILDAEYQFDRRLLHVYYSADVRIDFRSYVREMHGYFKSRVWMKQIFPTDEERVRQKDQFRKDRRSMRMQEQQELQNQRREAMQRYQPQQPPSQQLATYGRGSFSPLDSPVFRPQHADVRGVGYRDNNSSSPLYPFENVSYPSKMMTATTTSSAAAGHRISRNGISEYPFDHQGVGFGRGPYSHPSSTFSDHGEDVAGEHGFGFAGGNSDYSSYSSYSTAGRRGGVRGGGGGGSSFVESSFSGGPQQRWSSLDIPSSRAIKGIVRNGTSTVASAVVGSIGSRDSFPTQLDQRHDLCSLPTSTPLTSSFPATAAGVAGGGGGSSVVRIGGSSAYSAPISRAYEPFGASSPGSMGPVAGSNSSDHHQQQLLQPLPHSHAHMLAHPLYSSSSTFSPLAATTLSSFSSSSTLTTTAVQAGERPPLSSSEQYYRSNYINNNNHNNNSSNHPSSRSPYNASSSSDYSNNRMYPSAQTETYTSHQEQEQHPLQQQQQYRTFNPGQQKQSLSPTAGHWSDSERFH